jgi:hypothetical protein
LRWEWARTAGLLAASVGAIAVFSVGVLGVMGAARGAAFLLGAPCALLA